MGDACSVPFPLWREHELLGERLRELVCPLICQNGNGSSQRVAAVMTGELADCFASKKEGVEYIVDCLVSVCDRLGLCAPIFGSVAGPFLDPESAKRLWLQVAASNWYLTALFASGLLPDESGILIDVGSTTMDVIPFSFGRVTAIGKTDVRRLEHGELVYAGVGRTPVVGLLGSVEINGRKIPLASEYFASVKDALVVADELAEDPDDVETADGRPRTKSYARHRLARCLCADECELESGTIETLAAQTVGRLAELLCCSVDRVIGRSKVPGEKFVIAGTGEAWIHRTLGAARPGASFAAFDDLCDSVGSIGSVSNVAPAYCVAMLAKASHEG